MNKLEQIIKEYGEEEPSCAFCEALFKNSRFGFCKNSYGGSVPCPTLSEFYKEIKRLESQEVIELTDTEMTTLANLDDEYHWIAKNEDGYLVIFKDKPVKGYGSWIGGNNKQSCFFPFRNRLFSFISWKDEEPYNIEELLAEGGK